MLTKKEFAAELRKHENFLLLTHCRPDADTVGSAAALCLGLRKFYKKAYLLKNPDITPINAVYAEGLWAEDDFVPDCVVAVDIASRSMLPTNAGEYADRIDLSVDHHPSQEFFAAETCLDASAAACGEIIYDVLKDMGIAVDTAMAERLYAAIATDTGCFLYSNVTPKTHSIAAKLLETGLDFHAVNKRHFMTKSLARLKLEAHLTASTELFDEGLTAVMSLPLSIMECCGATENDADNIAAFVSALQGVDCGVLLREIKPCVWKVSVRSGERVNASAVCAVYGGGGHAAAAGCTVTGTKDEVTEQMLRAIDEVLHG